jgi:hypothetical protein
MNSNTERRSTTTRPMLAILASSVLPAGLEKRQCVDVSGTTVPLSELVCPAMSAALSSPAERSSP